MKRFYYDQQLQVYMYVDTETMAEEDYFMAMRTFVTI